MVSLVRWALSVAVTVITVPAACGLIWILNKPAASAVALPISLLFTAATIAAPLSVFPSITESLSLIGLTIAGSIVVCVTFLIRPSILPFNGEFALTYVNRASKSTGPVTLLVPSRRIV